MLFSDAIEKYTKWRSFKVSKRGLNGHDLSLRHFCIFTRNPDIDEIKVETVVEWLSLLREMGFDENTLEKKAIALKKFFEFYRRQDCDVLHPLLIPMPRKKFEIPRVATEEIVLDEPEALFIGVKGGFHGQGARGKRLAICAAGEVFREYSNKAGLPQYLNAHSFRHHLGHELAKKGANNSVISSILGHSSLQSSYRYTALFDKELQLEYKKFSRK
jgi:site-specific recombinase XerD